MEFLSDLPLDSLVDPVVIVSALVVTASLLSGLVARLAQLLEDRQPQRSVAAWARCRDPRGQRQTPAPRVMARSASPTEP